MMRAIILAVAFLIALAAALELDDETFDDAVHGRTVFINLYAPWSENCKKMKAAWDQLVGEYENSKDVMVAQVDCSGPGEGVCHELGAKAYPTLKYGQPHHLRDYKGGRSYEDLKAFAAGLGPHCHPDTLQACTEEEKQLVKKFQAMSLTDRILAIGEKEKAIKKLESDFKGLGEVLQRKWKVAEEEKNKEVRDVFGRGGNLELLKAIHNYEQGVHGSGQEEEL